MSSRIVIQRKYGKSRKMSTSEVKDMNFPEYEMKPCNKIVKMNSIKPFWIYIIDAFCMANMFLRNVSTFYLICMLSIKELFDCRMSL